jgi:hypothetical protein
MARPSMLVKVGENEFKALLNRDETIANVKEHLSPWLDLLRDLSNYGSNLIPRCFSSSARGLKDAVVLGTLLRQIVTMLDGVEVLLSNGAPYTAQLQLRALLEASIYIEWILESDGDKKAAYYYVRNLRRKRMWASRTQPGSAESDEFIAMMVKDVGLRIDARVREVSKQQLQEIDRVLSQPSFAQINKDFDKHRKRTKYDPAWYVPLGQRSLGSIARSVGKASLYTIVYSGASEVMHSSSYEHHMKIGKGELTFQPIRSIEGFESVFRFAVAIVLSTFRRVLEEYRDGELPLFGRKYVEKWQQEFINFPKFKFEAKSTRI